MGNNYYTIGVKMKKNPMFKKEQFIGKTIAKVDNRALNYLVFTFSDGTKAAIETEAAGCGIYGIASTNPIDASKLVMERN